MPGSSHVPLRRKFLFLLLLLIFLAGIIWLTRSTNKKEKNSITPTVYPQSTNATPTDVVPQRMSLKGEIVCLQHKDTSGPQTLECAFGLKATDGTFYALNMGLSSQTPPHYDVGDTISANGIFTPIEMLSSDMWQKYNVKGIFSVTDSFEIL